MKRIQYFNKLELQMQNRSCDLKLHQLETSVSSIIQKYDSISNTGSDQSFLNEYQHHYTPQRRKFISITPIETNLLHMSPSEKFAQRWKTNASNIYPSSIKIQSNNQYVIKSISPKLKLTPQQSASNENNHEKSSEYSSSRKLKPSTISFSDDNEEEEEIPIEQQMSPNSNSLQYNDSIPKPNFDMQTDPTFSTSLLFSSDSNANNQEYSLRSDDEEDIFDFHDELSDAKMIQLINQDFIEEEDITNDENSESSEVIMNDVNDETQSAIRSQNVIDLNSNSIQNINTQTNLSEIQEDFDNQTSNEEEETSHACSLSDTEFERLINLDQSGKAQ